MLQSYFESAFDLLKSAEKTPADFIVTLFAKLKELGIDRSLASRFLTEQVFDQKPSQKPSPTVDEMYKYNMLLQAWHNVSKVSLSHGLYHPFSYARHPLQAENVPFFYNSSSGCYVGFYWEYGDTSPLPPPPTFEEIAKKPSMILRSIAAEPSNSEYSTTPSRFVAVNFHPGNIYVAQHPGHFLAMLDQVPGKDNDYVLKPGLKNMFAGRIDSVMAPIVDRFGLLENPLHGRPNPDFEIFITDPVKSIVSTFWYDWNT